MLLERTISQLDIGRVSPARANELGQMGYMQWLGGLRPTADYRKEAMRAHAAAQPFIGTSPAVAVFCELLLASTRVPIEALPLSLPPRLRRGGARARRAAT